MFLILLKLQQGKKNVACGKISKFPFWFFSLCGTSTVSPFQISPFWKLVFRVYDFLADHSIDLTEATQIFWNLYCLQMVSFLLLLLLPFFIFYFFHFCPSPLNFFPFLSFMIVLIVVPADPHFWWRKITYRWWFHVDKKLFKDHFLIRGIDFHVCSYGAGFIGSLVYMRMLGSSVDSMADGAKGLIK